MNLFAHSLLKKSSQVQNQVPPKKESKEKMTIQEKRKMLLQEKKSERIKQQEALGIPAERKAGTVSILKVDLILLIYILLSLQKRGGRSRSPPIGRGTSPLKLPSSRSRSASPRTIVQKIHSEKTTADNKQVS